MDLFIVRGGSRLTGRVAVGGSKNAALPIMAASLLIDGPVFLNGVPDLSDVTTLSRVLESLGVEVESSDSKTDSAAEPSSSQMRLEVRDESSCIASYDLVRRMRASVCVLGPLLAKRRRAVVSLPGGCNIGDRPIDLHLRGLTALGADVRIERGYVVANADRLRGAELSLAGPRGTTVTGTANILMAAVLAEGRTVIRDAAREPEVDDLARFLVAAGANIEGVGTGTLEIRGVEGLRSLSHSIIPDRVEAVTLMIAAAITGGDVLLDRVPVRDLDTVLAAMTAAGIAVEPAGADSLRVHAPRALSPVDIATTPFPGFPTDLQAQWTALMTLATGTSCVTDTIFPERFLHVPELNRLGADITRSGSSVVINGGQTLRGANLMASDLRASAALVLAALAAEGESVIRRIYHLDRGYELLDAKLNHLGANITRLRDDSAVAVQPPKAA